MTKDLLIKKYAEMHNLSKKQAEKELDKFGDFVVSCVENEGVFRLSQVVEIKRVPDSRELVTNPQTGLKVANNKSYKVKTKVLKRILDLR